MSWHSDQLKYALGIGGLVSFYGLSSLAIYFIGSYFDVGLIFIILLIALLLLTWPIFVIFNYFRKRRKARKEAAAGGAQQGGATPPQAAKGRTANVPSRAYDELTRGAEEAVQWLRSTRLGGAKSNDAVYGLPWFIVAGPPASGKTSLVLSSGLSFQALPSQRRAEQHIVRPTRNVEWDVTDQAVILDTAGRYQNETPDRDEWSALTETVKRYRGGRPLDGLLVAVDASRIVRMSETEIEQQAKTLRARLDDLMARARVRFPVYLVFTHADSIEGFGDFFSTFGRAGQSEVWGATIPLEKSMNAHALFDVEFDALYDSLMRRRLIRLGHPAKPDVQLRVFDFPLRFGEARSRLGLFTSSLFRPNPFSESPLLRGFYFTANVTDGAVAAAQQPREAAEGDGHERPLRAVGQGFFAERFFKEVLLRDKDIAAAFQSFQRKPPRWRYVLLALGFVILFLLTAGMVISYLGNRALVADAAERGANVDNITRADVGKDPTKKDAAATQVELEAVDSLREKLVQLDEYDKVRPPLYLRFGLYSGNAINPPLRTIYFDSVEQRFKKPTVAALEKDLRAFVAGNATPPPSVTLSDSSSNVKASNATEDILGKNYDLLKAYLMLSDATKVEPTFLASTLSDYWKRNAPPGMEIISLQQLDFWTKQMASDDAPHIKTDDKLVAAARTKLTAYPAVNRFYKRVTTEVNAKVQPVNLDNILEGRKLGVLESTYTVPGSYTIEGYRGYMRDAIQSAAEEMSKDDWVMGAQAAQSKDQSADIGKLQNMYFRDYADQWDRFIKGVRVREFKSKDDAVDKLKALAGTDSPMERVMLAVERNTNLSANAKPTGWWPWIKSWFTSSSNDNTGGGTVVEKEFKPIFGFANEEAKKESTPSAQYRQQLKLVADQLELQSADQLAQTSKSLLTGKDDLGLSKAEQNISNLTEPFKTTASAGDAATLLKQPLDRLRGLLYGGGYELVEKTWREQIYPKAHALESGFPFTDAGESSVTDLSRFLNPANGQFSTFFNQQLASSFEDVQGQWKLKETGAFKFNDDFITYLNRTRILREALFPNGGQQPEVSYELILQPTKDADIEINIDGTPVQTSGASPASSKFTWPARSGSSGATIRVRSNAAGAQDIAPKTFPGEWGLFKMFAAGGPNKTGDNSYALAWNVGGIPVRATLRPSSTNNPFNRSLFTTLHAPQSVQK